MNLWFEHRRKRLTASHFGIVMNRRTGTPSGSFLNRFLKQSNFIFKACEWGKANESIAIKKYENSDLKITRCGLIINSRWPWLGCSPDF